MTADRRPLEPGFETEFATAVIGVDTLVGGDIKDPSGRGHFVADAYPKDEVDLPSIYDDERAVQIRASTKEKPVAPEVIRSFAADHDLLDVQGRLTGALPEDAPEERRIFVRNMERSLELIARTAVALAEGSTPPSFEERYMASNRRPPILLKTADMREKLREALSNAGVEMPGSKNLREGVAEWEARLGHVPRDDFSTEFAATKDLLIKRMREELLAHVDFPGDDPHLLEMPFDGLSLQTISNERFTASSAFQGGILPDGRPASRGLIEYNTDHPVTRQMGMPHLISHEVAPGHYVDSALADLGWRRGDLGFEAVVQTMATASTVLREGWAQNALAAVYGGEDRLVEAMGPDQVVQYYLERFQDVGKHNGPILWHMMGVGLETLRAHLERDCALSDPLVNKLSGPGSSRHPIIGPSYNTGYWVGQQVVSKAMETHGVLPVAQAAFHRHGYLDIESFEVALAKAQS